MSRLIGGYVIRCGCLALHDSRISDMQSQSMSGQQFASTNKSTISLRRQVHASTPEEDYHVWCRGGGRLSYKCILIPPHNLC